MEHAASPSLISLGLPTDTSSEESSFRWGLVLSCALHALIIILSMFIRFQSESEQPLRTIDVALISLPTIPTTTPRPTPSPTKKTAAAPKKVSPPAAAPPVEETLAPLPTETASERLSESLGGAINSILVPQKREPNPSSIPSQELELHPTQDQSPLVDTLHLPSAPPTISRPKRLQPAEPVKAPSAPEAPIVSVPKKTPAPVKSQPPPTPTIQPSVKPAPTIPSLSEVTPFTKPEPNPVPPQTRESSSIEESLKRTIPNIQTSPSKPTIPERSRKRPTNRLATIPESPKAQASVPARPKMSDTVKKLMEGLKSTRRTPAPSLPQPKPSAGANPSISPPSSVIDKQIAKLSIPEVTPVESIKQRLDQIQMQSLSDNNISASQQSPGENRYFAIIEDAINRHWKNPDVPINNKKVILTFHVAKSGEISRVHVDQSSGNTYYDSAILGAINKANPLPKFPSDLHKSFLDIKFLFTMPEQ